MAEANPTAFVSPAILNGSNGTGPPPVSRSQTEQQPRPASNDERLSPGLAYPHFVMPANLPRPPFLDIDGIGNFRSLGGYLSTDGRNIVRPNLFYRCAHPMQLSFDGLEQLTNTLGVKAIYDFRSGPEVRRTTAAITAAAMTAHAKSSMAPSSLPPALPCTSPRFESIHHFTPVFAKEDTGPDALARKLTWYSAPNAPRALPFAYSEGFLNAYRHIAEHGSDAYTVVFRHILTRPTDPFVFHCTAGKDRTGVLAAILLRLAGVDDDTICWEYSLTEPGLGLWRTMFMDRMCGGPSDTKVSLQGEAKGNDDGHSHGATMTREEAARVVGSRSGNIRAFLIVVLDGEYGGAERYLSDQCGFTAEEVEQIKQNLVVGLDVVGEEAIVRPVGIDGWTPEGGCVD